MDKEIKKITPDYRQIYFDIITEKYPQKIHQCKHLLSKQKLSVIEIIDLNYRIFGASDKDTEFENQKYRSYGKTDILEILDYQKKHQLNNTQLAIHFKLSRNSVAKWRKMFL